MERKAPNTDSVLNPQKNDFEKYTDGANGQQKDDSVIVA